MSRTIRQFPARKALRHPKTRQEIGAYEAARRDGIHVRHARHNLPTLWDDKGIAARREVWRAGS